VSQPAVPTIRTASLLESGPHAIRDAGGPAWLQASRQAAWEAFESLPMPAEVYREEWRRTDLSGLDPAALAPPHPGAAPAEPDRFAEIGERAGLLVRSDGATVTRTLADAAVSRGVLFMDLAAAASAHPDLVRAHLHSTLGEAFDRHRLRALNAALWSGGTLLYVPRGVEVALPLVAQTWVGPAGGAVLPRTLVVADEGSRVTLIDLYRSAAEGPRAFACGVTELILRAGAHVRHVVLQEWGLPLWEAGSLIRAHLDRDATLNSLVVALGGGLVKLDVESRLAGPGASSEMLGIYAGDGSQHVDLHTLQEHRAPHTLSDLLYKGVVTDRARAVFAGLIRVDWGAQKTNAFQANRTIILSDGARSDSIPKLEIMANDLRCTHGSATSRLNEEHIFYLMSRGLSRERATHLIVEGFFADVLDRVPLEGVRGALPAKVLEKIR
jgi:Fe-S cluster assembly protein SufD